MTLENSSQVSPALFLCLLGLFAHRGGYNDRVNTFEKQLAQLLTRYPQIRMVMLFGSLATDRAKPDSDIDLGVLADERHGSTLVLEQKIESLRHCVIAL